MYRKLAALASFAVAACATARPAPQVPGLNGVLLALPPASYGRTVSFAQQIQIEAGDHLQEVQVYLQIDPKEVNLAALIAGQTAAKLTWDGTALNEFRSAWLPQQLRGETILSDLQLALWPASAIASALPQSFRLVETSRKRQLFKNEHPLITIQYLDANRIEMVHHTLNYRLSISSVQLDEAP